MLIHNLRQRAAERSNPAKTVVPVIYLVILKFTKTWFAHSKYCFSVRLSQKCTIVVVHKLHMKSFGQYVDKLSMYLICS